MGFENQAYEQTNTIPGNDPEYVEIGPLEQPSVGFSSPCYDPGNVYQALNNANERPDNVYQELNISPVTGGQSEA